MKKIGVGLIILALGKGVGAEVIPAQLGPMYFSYGGYRGYPTSSAVEGFLQAFVAYTSALYATDIKITELSHGNDTPILWNTYCWSGKVLRASDDWWLGNLDTCRQLIADYTCPAEGGGWELQGTTCVRSNAPKNASPKPELCAGNPVNSGIGTKFETQAIYTGAGSTGVEYQLSYANRLASDPYAKVRRLHGIWWFVNYGMNLRLNFGTSTLPYPGSVTALRPNGQFIEFVWNGSAYASPPDIAHKLTRISDAAGTTTGWQLFDADTNSIETYRANGGGFLSVQQRTGAKATATFDAGGSMQGVTDAYGRFISMMPRDSTGRAIRVLPPDGQQIQFSYDGNNNLKTITWQDGKVRTYHYEDSRFPNHLTGITDENNSRYATWAYDSQARAISSQHAGGADLATLTYNSGNTVVTDARGAARTINLTTVQDVVRGTGSSQPGGSGCGPSASAQTYDANGNIASRTDFNGNKACYGYDLSRNLETRRVEGLASAVDCTSALSSPPAPTTANPVKTITTQWHSYWRLPFMVAEPKKLTTYVYNGDTYAGNVVTCAPAGATVPSISGGTQPIGVLCRKIEQNTTDASGSQGVGAPISGTDRISNWTYNQYGQVLTADGPRTDVSDITTYTYHPANDPVLGKRGNLATVTNALGHVTQIPDYDANGRPLTIIDPNNVSTTLAYDLRGRLTSKTTSGEVTSYQYDGVGQMTKVTLPDSSYINYTYDAAHRLTDITDNLGNTIHYTLDAMGNRTTEEVKDPQGTLTRQTTRVYDALNRLQTLTGAQ